MYPSYRIKESFQKYKHKLLIDNLCENPNSLNYLSSKLDLISDKGWEKLCLNKNPHVIFILEKNISKLSNRCWDILASRYSHPDLFSLVENNLLLLSSNSWELMASNPNPKAITLIQNNLKRINSRAWMSLIKNEKAINIIKRNFFIIENNNYWEYLCSHKEGIDLIIEHKKINYLNFRCWKMILSSFSHYQMILDNLERFTKSKTNMWEYICLNEHPQIVSLIAENIPIINRLKNSITCWENICLNKGATEIINIHFDSLYEKGLLAFISQNDNACKILNNKIELITQFKNLKFIIPNIVSNEKKNRDLILEIFSYPTKTDYSWDIWMYLFRCETLVHLIENNFDSIFKKCYSLYDLCGNKEAIHLIEKCLPFLEDEWSYLSENPSIFEPDYDSIEQKTEVFKEELISAVFHPKKMVYYLDKYNYDIGDEDYFS